MIHKAMRFWELLKMVFANIFSGKSKCALTSLGIAAGSATIVLVTAVGQGGRADVAEQFKNLNAGAVEISAGQTADYAMEEMMENFGGGRPDFGGGNMPDPGGFPGGRQGDFSGGMSSSGMPSFGGRMSASGGMPGAASQPGGGGAARTGAVTLTEEDACDIEELVPGIESVSIVASGDAAVEGGDLEEETAFTAAGVGAEYPQVTNLEILYGSFFDEYALEDRDKVCVLGYRTAQTIFGAAYLAAGNFISIEGKNYEVVGVLASMGTVSSGISPDEAIYIPYTTARKYVFGNSVSPTITAVADDVSRAQEVMESIETVLTQNYPDAVFTVTDAGSQMKAAQKSADTLQALLAAAAVIVFAVGGIGIMNVLFVTVKERTGEIGLLKALGSSRREILAEFLMEAAFISLFGGIAGTAAGYALIPAVRLTGVSMEIIPGTWILALAFAAATGTLFGFYPALKASRLTPIEALGSE